MNLPPGLRKTLLNRFDELLKDGELLGRNVKETPGQSGPGLAQVTSYQLDVVGFVTWRTKCNSLLSYIIPPNHFQFGGVRHFAVMGEVKEGLDRNMAFLKAIRDDFEKGFLGDITTRIEAEISADYMGQAEQLLTEGQTGKFDHVPAAVLAGAVLEKTLRALCGRQQPLVDVKDQSGRPKMLNALIDDLKKAELFNELKAKQLRAWADIRNKAAHGEFDQFNRSDVEQMVTGVRNFLADYVK
jgi:hypothetical protein